MCNLLNLPLYFDPSCLKKDFEQKQNYKKKNLNKILTTNLVCILVIHNLFFVLLFKIKNFTLCKFFNKNAKS